MLGAKLFILLFVVIIAEAQYRRLPLTTKSWEASIPLQTNLPQNITAPDVIIVYPETQVNKTSPNHNYTVPVRYPTFKPIITSFKGFNLSHSFPKHDQEEELNKVLKERPNSQPEQTQENSDKLQSKSKPDPEMEPQTNPKLETKSGQEYNRKIKANSEPKPDNKPDVESPLQPAMVSDTEVKVELKQETEGKPEPETLAKLESQSETDAEPKLENRPVSEQHQNPETNTQSIPEPKHEIFPESPVYKPSETVKETEIKSKEKPKKRPRPTYPGYYKTYVPLLSTLDHELYSDSPAESSIKPSSQTPIPIKSTRATTDSSTAHNLSMTTLRPVMEILCTEENAYHAIPNECDTFVECKEYVADKYICPDGLLFNSKAHWPEYPCAYPSEVECGNKTITQDPEPVGECPRRFGTFPSVSGDCGKYVVCDDGRAIHLSCPNGLAFNTITSGCDWPENVPNCKPKVFDDFTCPSPPKDLYDRLSEKVYNYKYRDSCKEYIACSKGEPRLLRCDSGLSFDEISRRCLDSKFVKNCASYSST